MIQFACRCKHRFSLDEDTAGGTIQCPDCGRLNDIPTLDDLAHLDEDGAYKLDVELPKDDPIRVAELNIIYSGGGLDRDGDEIDLRLPSEDNGPLELKDEPPAPRPRYDPETGELIRPLDVKPDDRDIPVASIPMAKPVISYATKVHSRAPNPATILVALFQPGNFTVMAFIFFGHVFVIVLGAISLFGFLFLLVAQLVLVSALIAHYGCVVEETGPEASDELPRPFRNAAIYDDIWGPFTRIIASFLFASIPLIVVRWISMPVAAKIGLSWVAFGMGFVILPAVLLTFLTSGSFENLRPDRIWGVMRTCGWQYVISVIAGAVTLLIYFAGLFGVGSAIYNIFSGQRGGFLARWLVALPSLAVGVYLAHACCWHLGLLYRANNENFPWAFQRHISKPKPIGTLVDPNAPAAPARNATEAKLRKLKQVSRARTNPAPTQQPRKML